MNAADLREDAIMRIASTSDADIAAALFCFFTLMHVSKASPEAVKEGMTEFVAAIRAAERIRIEREKKGAAIAADLLKETP